MVGVAPSIAIQKIAAVPYVFVVIELKLIFFTCSFEHHPKQYPRTNIESGELNEHFPSCLSDFS